MSIKPVSNLYLISYEDGTPYKSTRDAKEAVDAIEAGFKVEEFVSLENHRAAMLQAGNSPVIPDGSEWTNEQCLEFLTVAFRHNEISGDIEFDDIRLGVKFALSAAPQEPKP